MSPTPKNTRSNVTLIVPSNTLEETMNIVKTTKGAVKDANEARKYLEKTGWCTHGEPVTLEILTKSLLAQAVNLKNVAETANVMIAVAHLLTSGLHEGIAQGVARSIAKLLKHSIASMTVDIRENLELHAGKLAEAAESQTTIAQSMQKTQENMAESAKQAATQAKSYSQAVATPHSPHPQSTPPVTHSQLQIQNREQIKRRQVLIDFEKTEDLELGIMDEKTLHRKATDALNTCLAVSEHTGVVKLKAGTLLRNGGLLLELNSDEAAGWLKSDRVIGTFLKELGSGVNIKNRTYQVIVQFAPVSFDPMDGEHIRSFEENNNIASGSIAKMEWIKPVKNRKPDQKVATLRVFHRDAESANAILKHGAHVFSRRVKPRRPHKEPIRCLRCHKFGHDVEHEDGVVNI